MQIERALSNSLIHACPSLAAPDLLCFMVDGKPRFSFEQRIWLKKDVKMDWNGDSLAQRTLSANILSFFVSGISAADSEADLPNTFIALVNDFVEDVIITMPSQGGRMPVDVLCDWINERTSLLAA